MRRFRKVILVVLVLLGVLLIAGAITVEVIRRSQVPRNIAVDQVEHLLGVDLELERLEIGYGGHVVLGDVSLTMPFEDQPLATVAEVHLHHTPAWKLLFGSGFEVERVEVRSPVLSLRQDATGQWNLAELIARATALAGQPAAGAARPGSAPPRLPAIAVTDARVEVYDNQQHQLTVSPVSIAGEHRGLLYDLAVEVPGLLKVEGEVSPGGTWSHRLKVVLADAQRLAEAWTGAAIPAIDAQLSWAGRATSQGLTGQLFVDAARLDRITADGHIAVDVGPSVVLGVRRLVVTPAPYVNEPLEVTGGRVTLDGALLTWDELNVLAFGGRIWADGRMDLQLQQGEAKVAWEELAYPAPVAHQGELVVALEPAFPDKLKASATIDSSGQSPAGAWETQVNLAAMLTGSEHVQATINVPALTWTRDEQAILLRGVEAKVGLADRRLTLQSLTADPAESLRGFGWYDLDTQAWAIRFSGERFPVDLATLPHRRYALEAEGSPEQVELVEALLTRSDQELRARGVYRAGREDPLDLSVSIAQQDVQISPEDAASLRMDRIAATAAVRGTLQPMALEVSGDLDIQNLAVADHLIQEALKVDLTGTVTQKELRLRISPFAFLDGQWHAGFRYAMEDQHGRGTLEIQQMSIPAAITLAGASAPVQGTLDGRFELALPQDGPPTIQGQWSSPNLTLAEQQIKGFEGRMRMRDGRLTIESVDATHGQGTFHATAELELRTQQLRLEADLTRWPVRPEGDADNLHISGRVDARVDLPAMSMLGDVDIQSRLTLRGEQAGEQVLTASLQGQSVVLEEVRGDVLHGALAGHGEFRLDAPLESRLDLRWSDVATEPIARIFPGVERLEGAYTGTLAIGPVDDPTGTRASRISLNVDARDGRYGQIAIGDAALIAEVAPDPNDGLRYVLHRSLVNFADGTLHLWGRVSRHLGKWYLYGHTEIGLPLGDSPEAVAAAREAGVQGLDIAQFSRTFAPDMEPVQGRLSGTLRLTQPLDAPRRAYGEIRLSLVESDLASYGLFARMYDLLNIGAGGDDPTGDGSIDARLEGRRLRLVNMDYRNRGIQFQIKGQLEDIYLKGQSPIRGTAVASAIPLPELPLVDQLIKDLKEALGTLQEGIMGFDISNTLAEPEVRQTSLSGALGAIKGLISSDERTDDEVSDTEKAAAEAARGSDDAAGD